MTLHTTAIFRFCISLSLLLCSLGTQTVLAEGGDDWVLVKRFEEQLQKARQGDTQAMYEVGRMYERGRGTAANIQEALKWFEKSASSGQNSDASGRIGIIYLEGQGVPHDYQKAFKYLSEAARAGSPAAQYFLALMYEQGHGVPQNAANALAWYKKAAKGGYYQAEQGIARLGTVAGSGAPEAASPPVKPAQATAPTAKPDLTRAVIAGVLAGAWESGGRPASFLPSSAATCKQETNKTIKCVSAEQSRDTGFAVITYVTESILDNFSASDEFTVTYYNNVLKVKQEDVSPSGDGEPIDDGFGSVANKAVSRVKLGKQKQQHQLDCTLKDQKTLECVKNRTSTLIFVNKK